MSRTIPFDPVAVCDVCGKTGAFDFMGDIVCADCCADLADDLSDEDALEFADFDDLDADEGYGDPDRD